MSIYKIIILFILLALPSFSFGQEEIVEVHYMDKYKSKISKNHKKSKFVETIKSYPDSLSSELRRVEDNLILEQKNYKNDIPCGVWKYYNAKDKAYKEYNYNFRTEYSSALLEEVVYVDLLKGEPISGVIDKDEFSPPIFLDDTNMLKYLYGSIWYPSHARENGTDGTVSIHIKISKLGYLEVISVYKGVEPHLDVESIRALLLCKNWKPAILNGEAIDTYSIFDVKFKLQ